MSRADEPVIEHARLRSAIEFAVLVAEETQKRKPPMAVPATVKAFFGKPRVPSAALGRLRRAIEADPVFRSRLAAGALPELVDEVGRLWLQQPFGWEAEALAIVTESKRRAADTDAAVLLGRADKRRRAAEVAAGRAKAEAIRLEALLDDQQVEIDRLRADVAKADDVVAEARAELLDVRNEARHARDREHAAAGRLAKVTAERDEARNASPSEPSSTARIEVDPGFRVVADAALQGLIDSAESAAESAAVAARLAGDSLAAIYGVVHDEPIEQSQSTGGAESGVDARQRVRRRPLALPGGVIATSAEAAGHLARSDASMLIDGYNVAMLARPRLSLADQRAWLIDSVENVVRRFGTDATIVFDGAHVVGSHTATRRSTRIVYSPAGVIADDVIRDEIDRLPDGRHVVVVTNDAELARDARARGANVVPSNALVALL
jgi:hypothetical protein